MNQLDLEAIYEALAHAIDQVGEKQAEVYLAKVALGLAESLGETSVALSVIEECKAGFGK